MRIAYLLLVFILFLYSCEVRPKYSNAHTFRHEDITLKKNIKGKILEFDIPVMMPMSLSIVDSVLILINLKTEFFIHRYNVKSLKKIGESISFGSGPNEMLGAKKIQITDSTIWLFDQMKQKILQYEIPDFCFSDSPVPLKMIQFTDQIYNVLVLPNNRIALTAIGLERKRLSFADMQGKLIAENGEFPDFGRQLNPYEKIEAASCNMTFNQSEEKICLTYKCTDLIEFYDLDGNLLQRIHGPDQFFPELHQYNMNDDAIKVASIKGKTRDAYFSPVTYHHEVWSLFSGKYYDPGVRNNYLLDTIIVFDWTGKPLRQYKLDIPVFTFTIDSKNNILYGITDDPEFNIVQYDIK